MSKEAIRRAAAIGSVLALAAAPAALAARPDDPGGQGHGRGQEHGKGHAKSGGKRVMYVFKGTYLGDGSVDVAKGNAHVKKAGLAKTTVPFNLSSAKLVVADTDGDGVDVDDVAAGDRVVVKARLPRKDPGDGPYAAKQLVDQTNPPLDRDEGAGDAE